MDASETVTDRTDRRPTPARRALRTAWQAWTRLARRIGDVQARVILTVFYYAILGPFALALRWRSDPLGLRPGAAGWRPHPDSGEPPLERARRQS